MKITDVRTYIVMNSSIFVRVLTDEGINGIGECSPMNCKVIAYLINTTFKPMLVGENPLEIEKLWNKMFFSTYKQGVQGLQPEAIAGIDIALWDILGKYTNLSLHQLLGGAYRDKIQLYASIGGGAMMQVRDMVRAVEAKLEEGHKAFKIRMDWHSTRQDVNPKKDLEMFREVKSILDDDFPLSFDANNGYSVPTAISQGRKFEKIGIYHYEEPVAQHDYAGLKKVCDALDVPVSAGEHEYTRWQFHDLITRGGVDIIQPDVVKCAGISEMRKIIVLGGVFNKMFVPHQTQPTIGTTATIHLCASIQNCNRPQEYTGPRPILDDLFVELPKLEDGFMKVPTSPGIGLEANPEIFEEVEFKS
ncbi:MAG: mandelate racemase/muconate lactonizing enzyme family protein [Candidatus Hodarchaeota archaeon]